MFTAANSLIARPLQCASVTPTAGRTCDESNTGCLHHLRAVDFRGPGHLVQLGDLEQEQTLLADQGAALRDLQIVQSC